MHTGALLMILALRQQPYGTDGTVLSFGPCLAVAEPHPCRRHTGALLFVSCIWLARIVHVRVMKKKDGYSTGYIERRTGSSLWKGSN